MLKRIFDLTAVVLTGPVWGVLIIGVSFVVRLKLGRPIFFRQSRPGLNGRVFQILKFRTMSDHADAHGKLLPDRDRLTPFGKWLRETSLDELPELVNVLRGDMSLVGPRPLLVEYLPRYTTRQARRHEVRPGITGLAQIKGRNAISWDERFEWDLEYVETRSLLLDLKVLALTIRSVFLRTGINAPGQATMSKFNPPETAPHVHEEGSSHV